MRLPIIAKLLLCEVLLLATNANTFAIDSRIDTEDLQLIPFAEEDKMISDSDSSLINNSSTNFAEFACQDSSFLRKKELYDLAMQCYRRSRLTEAAYYFAEARDADDKLSANDYLYLTNFALQRHRKALSNIRHISQYQMSYLTKGQRLKLGLQSELGANCFWDDGKSILYRDVISPYNEHYSLAHQNSGTLLVAHAVGKYSVLSHSFDILDHNIDASLSHFEKTDSIYRLHYNIFQYRQRWDIQVGNHGLLSLSGAVGWNVDERFNYSDQIKVWGGAETLHIFWNQRRDLDFETDPVVDPSLEPSEYDNWLIKTIVYYREGVVSQQDAIDKIDKLPPSIVENIWNSYRDNWHNEELAKFKKHVSNSYSLGLAYRLDLKENSPEISYNVNRNQHRALRTMKLANTFYVKANRNLYFTPFFSYVWREGMDHNPIIGMTVGGKIIHPIYYECHYQRGNTLLSASDIGYSFNTLYKTTHEGWIKLIIPLVDDYGKFSIRFGFQDLYTHDYMINRYGKLVNLELKSVTIPVRFTYSHCF